MSSTNSLKSGFHSARLTWRSYATLTRGALGNRTGYLAAAEAAERLGYGFISVNDHIVVPRDIASRYPYSESGEWAGRTAGECLESRHTCDATGCTRVSLAPRSRDRHEALATAP